MLFQLPRQDGTFEIPDAWWEFADMASHQRIGEYYPYEGLVRGEKYIDRSHVELVPLQDIEPLRRDRGTPLFRKYKLVPVLMGLRSPHGFLPPCELRRTDGGRFKYTLHNGCHRFYASVAVGYSELPVLIDR
ncbi:hypothetical protein [Rhodopseudomonas palustris]|uniref:hypothetical protein n=1 Tax=Rhodopseudomonas palustris TaxID=1076 RepID=UPI000D1BE816|nr:hypothetical protein [Rhodopseudomonas palustris]AVT81134.1 hypothetical protein RPYSC3_22730 [Rhodopseudomonas palustris]